MPSAPAAVAAEKNRILTKMLDRLFATLVNGPSLNCRPHSSRQRVDWTLLGKFKDASPEDALRKLLGEDEQVKLTGRVTVPKRVRADADDEAISPADRAARQAWTDQLALTGKLRGIAEDAKTYEQDTGVHVLNIGFPLLSLPPAAVSGGRNASRRIIAPIAFVPVTVTVKSGAAAGVVIACKGEGVDRVTPNTALLAWLEQQTGKRLDTDLFADEEGSHPWREISELVRHVCKVMELPVPEIFEEQKIEESPEPDAGGVASATRLPDHPEHDADASVNIPLPATDADTAREPTAVAEAEKKESPLDRLVLRPAPRTEETDDQATIHLAAVLGLFPVTNQGLLRDLQAMSAGEPLAGPVTSFVQANVSLDAPLRPVTEEPQAEPLERKTRDFAQERLVAQADPCQARAVRLARQSRGLVIHGPPGTGKSQTITNIVGDHLARGERVLLVSDKRTALDVVANRLEHMGLGRLVAVVHDPQRDQRDLYRTIRDQLETLADVTTDDKAQAKLAKVDAELQELHAELTGYHNALMSEAPPATGGLPVSFHTLVGRWLALPDNDELARLEGKADTIALADLDEHARMLDETLARATKVEWWSNPWRDAAGIELSTLMGTPAEKWRETIARCVPVANAADDTIDPAIPPFIPNLDLRQQADARAQLADRLTEAAQQIGKEVLTRYASKDEATLARVRKKLDDVAPQAATLRAGALDPELALTVCDRVPAMGDIAPQLGALENYLAIAGKWYAFLQFKSKAAAREVVAKYGLALSPGGADRLKKFLIGLRARLVLQALHYELHDVPNAGGLLSDESLDRTLTEHRALLDLIDHVRQSAAVKHLLPRVVLALNNPSTALELIQGLRLSSDRASAILKLEESLTSTRLLSPDFLATLDRSLRTGGTARETVQTLADRVDDVESILRVRAALAHLPPSVRDLVQLLCDRPVEPDAAVGALRKAALTAEITRRLAGDPRLQNVDGQRVSGAFDRYRKLEEKKRDLVRDVILHQWTTKQKDRLLASTGSRLGTLGAELKRRLTMRGERAMRLRQVLAAGQRTEGGDPLFDVAPVWMASPETVAQLFPRTEVFSVIIFDEASQCRLEEALPVLTRGQRVVIAGDPKQLPPTRFFESAVAQSADEEIETDQQLFEAQQGEIEDLLAAALNLSIDQCYLDVHYRSRSAELIEFSNEHFYGSRLQAIPGHPSNRAETAPLLLHRADGVYEKRENEAEAIKVVEIVRGLLKGKEPPSIGIACFNLQQRDLIVEKLDEGAVEDERFAKKLADARSREGKGSFEGLFVKNLENVQGDERDHIIISTTYGPDKSGRFYRRFGPLGMPGGGRRLNVLVTRAREAVHLVTSIPADVYRALPPIPAGQAPTGGWLLFSYLKYAEEVSNSYRRREDEQPEVATPETLRAELAEAQAANSVVNPDAAPSPTPQSAIDNPQSAISDPPEIRKRPTKTPSAFTESLAEKLVAEHHIPSDVYWGNEGFMVDLALRDPENPENVTLGVLCDASRFANVADPVEWDVFRTGIHEGQGWRLHRVWSPHVFRDPKGATRSILREARAE
jgi:hypothetical protein